MPGGSSKYRSAEGRESHRAGSTASGELVVSSPDVPRYARHLEVTLGLVVLLALGLTLRRFGARGWLVLGALMLTCFVTNPDKAKHAAAVKDKVVAQEPTAVGRIALDMAGGMVDPLLQYSNLGLLSITAADGHLVSVGLLNQVFVLGSTESRSLR